jgi:hypothetical protein
MATFIQSLTKQQLYQSATGKVRLEISNAKASTSKGFAGEERGWKNGAGGGNQAKCIDF